MNLLIVIEMLAAVAGLSLAILVTLFPRFGPASWTMVAFLIPGFLSAGTLAAGELMGWPGDQTTLLSFTFLIMSGAGGCLASYALERNDYAEQFSKHRWFFRIVTLIAPALAITVHVNRPVSTDAFETIGLIPLGPAGYAAAIYLLFISVIALANVEQTLRGAEEYVRWEIKFLFLGLASTLGAMVYASSQVLLYRPEASFLAPQTLRIFPTIFLCSCALIFQSWRRASNRSHVLVSQGVIYSTITLFSVGLYLIGSSLLARWAGQLIEPGIPLEPIVFIISLVCLVIILLGTTFRHRARRWIRRNIFAGKYDYRQFWMDATEKVRATDSPAVATAALAELVESGLASPDVSVWLRSRTGETLTLMSARGSIVGSLSGEVPGLIGPVSKIKEPVPVNEVPAELRLEWPAGFFELTKASLLVPLVSSDRLIGLVTIGADRSGRPFDRETREFLRVLAMHCASEFHKSELLSILVEAREAEAFQTFSTFLLHDLKNFASTLSLIAKNATRHHANPDFQLDAFQSVFETSEKMKKLCNSLRTFSSTLAADKRIHDLNDIARSVIESFETSLSSQLELELGDIPPVVVDKDEMARVLHNLILNAHEAAETGTIRFSTGFEFSAVVIRITDHGKGISKEFMEHELFQPFHTTKRDGLGIGLFQSKKIIEAHNGTIDLQSTEGQGTTVRIVLPVIESLQPQTASNDATDYSVLLRPQTTE